MNVFWWMAYENVYPWSINATSTDVENQFSLFKGTNNCKFPPGSGIYPEMRDCGKENTFHGELNEFWFPLAQNKVSDLQMDH